MKIFRFQLVFTSFFIAFSGHSQYRELSSYELETLVIKNGKEGKDKNYNIYTRLIVELEDFQKLKVSYDEISRQLTTNLKIEDILINQDSQRLEVVFDKNMATDDFLKVFKETLLPFQVFLKRYQETYLTKEI